MDHIDLSKSQKKRDADALKKIGVELVALSETQLAQLPLPEPLLQAILEAKRLSSHGAKKRQMQLIGKWMRLADHPSILAAYADLKAESNTQTAHFRAIEAWRRRLLEEGKSALTAFVDCYQPEDVQHLRGLIKKALQECALDPSLDHASPKPHRGASTALFRYLRRLMS